MAIAHCCRDWWLKNVTRVMDSIRELKQQNVMLEIGMEYHNDELVRENQCAKIVDHLGMVSAPYSFVERRILMEVKDMLMDAVTGWSLIKATLGALWERLSDSRLHSPASLSIVLYLLDTMFAPKEAKSILLRGMCKLRLMQVLNTLCVWLSEWPYSPNLGPLVIELMHCLENAAHYDILRNIMHRHVVRLFPLLSSKQSRDLFGPMMLHRLRNRMRESAEMFQKIIPLISEVLATLSKEESNSSMDYQRRLIYLCNAVMRHFPGHPINVELRQILNIYSNSLNALKPAWIYESNNKY